MVLAVDFASLLERACRMNRRASFLPLLVLMVLLCQGCSHSLEVKNINDYRSSSMITLSRDISMGVSTSNDEGSGKMLVTGTAQSLSNYLGKIVYPYEREEPGEVDIVTKITVKPDHKGSGANFFINFPGFLVWASAWNGFVYKPSYDIDITMLNAADLSTIDEFSIPIRLDVRHADIDRTWTQLTWLETGIIGFLGGVVFVRYDEDVTPLLEHEIQRPIGDFIAQEIAARLGKNKDYQALLKRPRALKVAPNVQL